MYQLLQTPPRERDAKMKPKPEHVVNILELLMDDLNLTDDKKSVLRNLPPERKWIMCVQHLSERYIIHEEEMHEISKLLHNPHDKALLGDFVVFLRSRPLRWISNFIQSKGLSVLLWNLKGLFDSSNLETEELYIRCLRSLMNNKVQKILIFLYFLT